MNRLLQGDVVLEKTAVSAYSSAGDPTKRSSRGYGTYHILADINIKISNNARSK
jgi:hypothetical protein